MMRSVEQPPSAVDSWAVNGHLIKKSKDLLSNSILAVVAIVCV